MGSPPPQQSPQQPSPQDPQQSDNNLIAGIAALLLVGASLGVTAGGIATLTGLPVRAVLGALEASGWPVKQARPGKIVTAYSVTRSANRMFRAAFVLNASRRLWVAIKLGKDWQAALKGEKDNWNSHRRATANRLLVAKGVDLNAKLYGPLLGWYSVNDSRTSPECRAAYGRNFTVLDPPVIGWPGSVHPHCRCTPGPPHPGAKMVNASLTVRRSDARSGFYPSQ